MIGERTMVSVMLILVSSRVVSAVGFDHQNTTTFFHSDLLDGVDEKIP